MEIFALIVAAVLGSTGIAGLLTGGVQITRSARLRQSIEKSMDLSARIGKTSQGGMALDRAAQVDAARLASVSLIPPDGRVRMMITAIVLSLSLTGAILLMMIGLDPDGYDILRFERAWPSAVGAIVFLVIYTGLFFVVADLRMRRKRDELVRAILEGEDVKAHMDNLHRRPRGVRNDQATSRGAPNPS